MKIKINEMTVELPDEASLSDALDAKNIKQQGIATAVNGTVISAHLRASTNLSDGDNVVIIKAFYGG